MRLNLWPYTAVFALSLFTWYTGDVNFRIDHNTTSVPVMILHDLTAQWEATPQATQAEGSMFVNDEGVRLALKSSSGDESISSGTSKLSGTSLGQQRVLAQASYVTHLVPPFKNAALLAEAHIIRLSKPQLYIRQEAKPLLYLAAYDEGRLVDELLIHRSSGFTETQTARALTVNAQPSTRLDMTWRITNPGIWRLDSASLSWVALNQTYPLVLTLLWFAWALVAIALVIFLAKRVSWKVRLALTAFSGLLLAGILLQQQTLAHVILAINQSLAFWLPANITSEAFFVQKAGHFIAFAALGLLAFTQQKRLRLSVFDLVLFFCILAFATEAMQRHIPKRSSSIDDMLIDISGVLAAYLIFWVFKTLLSLRRWVT